MSAVLSVHNLSKRFGGIVAVDGVSFQVAKGEILGIIGPNGSGKSTLFNCILGQLMPTAGEVRLDGRAVTGMRSCDLSRLGLARTFQLLQVFPQLTVAENLILAGQEHKGTLWSRLVGRPDVGLSETAAEMMTFFRLDRLADQTAGSLSYGQQKLLDAAMAFMARPRLVLLDEPAGGVNPTLVQHIAERIGELNKAGRTFLIVEHNMDFVMSLCHQVTVLDSGTVVASGPPEQVRSDPRVLDAYLGVGTDGDD
jgi:branched-chain amino acid transport system ATP-binding protein